MGIYGQDIDKLAEIHYDRMFDEYFAEDGEEKFYCECCGEEVEEWQDLCNDCDNFFKMAMAVVSLGSDEQQEYFYENGYIGDREGNVFDTYIKFTGSFTIVDNIAKYLFEHKGSRDLVEKKIKYLEEHSNGTN